jgi:kynurenine formamidase
VHVRVIDVSLPIHDGEGRLGVSTTFEARFSLEKHGWQGSIFSMFCHTGTHVDAPNHFIEGGRSIDEVPLTQLMGPAALVKLDDHGAGAAISSDTLEDRGGHVRPGDIAILRTGWTDTCWGEPTFWKDGPFLRPDGADWLLERGVKAVVYDFSEEYVVRTDGFRGEDCEVHHKLLGNDTYNIEYVHNLNQIAEPRCVIVALPLKLSGLDGSPARVLAIEGVEMPSTFELR